MGGWNCGGSDLKYAKIWIAMARINCRENRLNWRTWVFGSVSTCIMG